MIFRLYSHITRSAISKMPIFFGLLIMCIACSGYDLDDRTEDKDCAETELTSKTYMIEGLGRLRVLAVGNSYTIDGTTYIQDVMLEMGISNDDFCVYVLTMNGATLGEWGNVCKNDEVRTISLMAGGWEMPVTQGTMTELFAQDWDVIVFQQASWMADDYFSYNPALGVLTETARRYCTNERMVFAWHLIHSYANSYEQNFPKGEERWKSICLATQCVMAKEDFDLLIPMGTAIQNARGTSLNTENDLTRDGTHLAYGVGRYVAACTWVQALFAPAFCFSIMDKMVAHSVGEAEREDASKHADTYVPVTDDNRDICRQCAYFACLSPYKLQ